MKKNNVNWIFNDHAIERFFERTVLNITKKDIVKAISNKQIIYFKRINVTRSMAYISVKKEVLKTVMHRKKDKIITILPWKSIFQYTIKIQIFKYENKIYRINLFPDCYLETKKPNALTKMFEYQGKDIYQEDRWKKVRHDHPLFNELFNIAWSFFQTDEDHQNIKKERNEGNETFEIKGKAKKIESVIQFGVDFPKSFITEKS
jgi:hypothetical protein